MIREVSVNGSRFILKHSVAHPITPYSHFMLRNMPNVSGATVLDFGCGSGVLSIASAILGAQSVLATDTDSTALDLTHNNALANRVDRVQCVIRSELDAHCHLSKHQFDIILCNPSSLPMPLDNETYYAGGRMGLAMVEDALELANRTLSSNGLMLLVHTSLAPLSETFQIASSMKLNPLIIATHKLRFRSFYKPLLPYWHDLQSRGQIAYAEQGTVGFEYLHLVCLTRYDAPPPPPLGR